MYKKGSVIPIKGSAALINNNLTITSTSNKTTTFAVICRNYVSISVVDLNDNILTEKQLIVRTTRDGNHAATAANNSSTPTSASTDITPNLIEIKYIELQRPILVVCTTKGIFFYDSDGSNLLQFFSFNQLKSAEPVTYAKGVSLMQNSIVIGTSIGTLLIFDVQLSGNNKANIVLNSQIHEKTFYGNGIYDVNVNEELNQLCASDTKSNVAVWLVAQAPKLLYIIQNDVGFACTSICFYKEYLVTAFGNGIISIYKQGRKFADINAHAKWITTMTIRDNVLVSGSEDSYVRFWQLNEINAKFEVRHVQSEHLTDTLVSGVNFSTLTNRLYVTSYDNSEIIAYERNK